jgi:hypothetical protein
LSCGHGGRTMSVHLKALLSYADVQSETHRRGGRAKISSQAERCWLSLASSVAGPLVFATGSFCGNGGQAKTRGGPEGGRGRPGVTSLGRCREPLVSGEREAAGSVLALADCDNLVDGEVSVLEG